MYNNFINIFNFRFQEKNSETLKLALSTFSRLNFH